MSLSYCSLQSWVCVCAGMRAIQISLPQTEGQFLGFCCPVLVCMWEWEPMLYLCAWHTVHWDSQVPRNEKESECLWALLCDNITDLESCVIASWEWILMPQSSPPPLLLQPTHSSPPSVPLSIPLASLTIILQAGLLALQTVCAFTRGNVAFVPDFRTVKEVTTGTRGPRFMSPTSHWCMLSRHGEGRCAT